MKRTEYLRHRVDLMYLFSEMTQGMTFSLYTCTLELVIESSLTRV